MLTRIRNLSAPPVFEDDQDKTRTAAVLNAILLAMLLYAVLVGAIAVPLVFVEKLYSELFVLAALVLFATAYWLMRRGRVRFASTMFVCTLWIISTVFMLVSGGMTSVVAALYVTGTVATGLLLGARATVAHAVACILAGLGMVILEASGSSMPRLFSVPALSGWMNLVINLLMTVTVLNLVLRSLNDALALARQQVEERKQAQEALARQAQELARSNAELEQFAYVASHDLQEPLRMVRSYVQLLERRYQGQLGEDADEFIHFAVDGAERMQTLIADLLQYSRVSTHGKPFAPTDCSTALDHALTNLKVAIEECGAIIIHDQLPTLMADETQLTRLLQNLIGNAIKFHQKDTPPQVHIGVEHADGEWTFSVRDNGIGIDSGDFERVFMIFQRLHSREEYKGTGIGLAVCKKIVERHGGRIWVESEPGEGSTFYFTVPDQ
jgi:signal transduction histidine kinase